MKVKTATVLSVTILIGCVFALVGFASFESNTRRITSIDISIVDETNCQFLNATRVREHLDSFGPVIGLLENDISLPDLNQHLLLIPSVRKVDLYPTLDGVLHIELVQRHPKARVHRNRGEDFYIDELGLAMPLDPAYSARVPIIHADNLDLARHAMEFIEATGDDVFWSALIDQIIVNQASEMEIIPRIGARVFIGSNIDPKTQRRNLLTFYRAQVKTGNLRNYERIDLSYNDQVIARRYSHLN